MRSFVPIASWSCSKSIAQTGISSGMLIRLEQHSRFRFRHRAIAPMACLQGVHSKAQKVWTIVQYKHPRPEEEDTFEFLKAVFFERLHHGGSTMGSPHLKNSPNADVIAPVFWAWAQQQAAPEEPLHLTRRRAISMQLQADADLARAVHRESFLAIARVQRR